MSLYDEIMALTADQREQVLADLTPLTNSELESAYDEMLNDVYGEVQICGYSYSASHALYAVDKVAYRCGFADYMSDSDTYIEIGTDTYYADDVAAALEAYQDDQQ